MWCVVTSPHNEVWFVFISPATNVLEGRFSNNDWCVTVRVAKLWCLVIRVGRPAILLSATDGFAAIGISANFIFKVKMDVTHVHDLNSRSRVRILFDLLIEVADELIVFNVLWFLLDQVVYILFA